MRGQLKERPACNSLFIDQLTEISCPGCNNTCEIWQGDGEKKCPICGTELDV